jgi:hypothetical protein
MIPHTVQYSAVQARGANTITKNPQDSQPSNLDRGLGKSCNPAILQSCNPAILPPIQRETDTAPDHVTILGLNTQVHVERHLSIGSYVPSCLQSNRNYPLPSTVDRPTDQTAS